MNDLPRDFQGKIIPVVLSLLRHLELKLGPFVFGRPSGTIDQTDAFWTENKENLYTLSNPEDILPEKFLKKK